MNLEAWIILLSALVNFVAETDSGCAAAELAASVTFEGQNDVFDVVHAH